MDTAKNKKDKSYVENWHWLPRLIASLFFLPTNLVFDLIAILVPNLVITVVYLLYYYFCIAAGIEPKSMKLFNPYRE